MYRSGTTSVSSSGVLRDNELRNVIAVDILAAAWIDRRGDAAAGIDCQNLAIARVNDRDTIAISRWRHFRIGGIHPPLDLERTHRLLIVESNSGARCNPGSLRLQCADGSNGPQHEDCSTQTPCGRKEFRIQRSVQRHIFEFSPCRE